MVRPVGETTPLFRSEKKGCFKAFPARYALALLGFFGMFNVYAMRVNLSVAMVAMVHNPPVHDELNVACLELTGADSGNSSFNLTRKHQGEFNWGPKTQGIILGSFFYGYIVTQIPGGLIAEKYGAKWLYGIGVLVTAVFTLLTPLAARWSVGALVAVRVIEGLGEDPASHLQNDIQKIQNYSIQPTLNGN